MVVKEHGIVARNGKALFGARRLLTHWVQPRIALQEAFKTMYLD